MCCSYICRNVEIKCILSFIFGALYLIYIIIIIKRKKIHKLVNTKAALMLLVDFAGGLNENGGV